MSSGPATFAILLAKESYATQLAHQLVLFTPATSLGGVESLIEQRLVSDPGAHPCLGTSSSFVQSALLGPSSLAASLPPVRVSVGIEDFEDLKADLIQGFRKVVQVRHTCLPSP